MESSVKALCDIPKGTSSLPGAGPIDLRKLFQNDVPKIVLHVDLCKCKNHLHVVELQVDEEWARFIKIAKNCHEQNLEISNSPEGLVLRATKLIKTNEELLVWIGSDLLPKLDFPFLNLFNIKGNQAYFCHKCGILFENPNPLKVHLSFLCKSLESSRKKSTEGQVSSNKFYCLFPLGIQPEENQNKVIIMRSESIACKGKEPFIDSTSYSNILESSGEKKPSTTKDSADESTSISYQLEMKSQVCNNWKQDFSQGHVCPFCGKVYSRKYGLKIHIRTHTGYKPLKCKYCFRPFSDPSNLNKHVRLHSNSDAPYRCLKCEKVLARKRDLDRHMKSRHPDAYLTENNFI